MGNNHKMVMFNGNLISEVLLSRLMKIEDTIKDLNDNKRMNAPDMSAHLQMPELTLKKYIKLLGIKMHNKKPWSIADKSKWRKIILPMVKKGMLYKDIAKAVGSSTSVVYLWCVRNEIDRKTILANCWTNNKTNEKNKRPA
jgi:hypothetical protein